MLSLQTVISIYNLARVTLSIVKRVCLERVKRVYLEILFINTVMISEDLSWK